MAAERVRQMMACLRRRRALASDDLGRMKAKARVADGVSRGVKRGGIFRG